MEMLPLCKSLPISIQAYDPVIASNNAQRRDPRCQITHHPFSTICQFEYQSKSIDNGLKSYKYFTNFKKKPHRFMMIRMFLEYNHIPRIITKGTILGDSSCNTHGLIVYGLQFDLLVPTIEGPTLRFFKSPYLESKCRLFTFQDNRWKQYYRLVLSHLSIFYLFSYWFTFNQKIFNFIRHITKL